MLCRLILIGDSSFVNHNLFNDTSFQQSDFVLSESALQMQKPKEHEKGAPERSLL